MCEKLEKEVDSRLTIRAERLWSFRFCDSVSCQFHTSTIFPTNPTFHMLCKFIIHIFAKFCWNHLMTFQVWQLLLKNVEFLSNSGHTVAHVPGKVGAL